MASTRGFRQASQLIGGMEKRCLTTKEATVAIGRDTVNRHKSYYGRSDNLSEGGGPPGAPWPPLEDSTAERKAKKGKTQKLVFNNLLRKGYEYDLIPDGVIISNSQVDKVNDLQVEGVGRNKKKFIVVATNPEVQDPWILQNAVNIVENWVMDGKAKA